MVDENCIELDLTTIDGLRKIEHWGVSGNNIYSSSIGSIVAGTATVGAVAAGTVAGAGAVAGAKGGFFAAIGSAIIGLFRKRQVDVQQIQKVPQDAQLKFAQAIIASGKKNGAKKLKITVDKDIGASVGVAYVGANIKGQVGSDGKFHLEVEYK